MQLDGSLERLDGGVGIADLVERLTEHDVGGGVPPIELDHAAQLLGGTGIDPAAEEGETELVVGVQLVRREAEHLAELLLRGVVVTLGEEGHAEPEHGGNAGRVGRQRGGVLLGRGDVVARGQQLIASGETAIRHPGGRRIRAAPTFLRFDRCFRHRLRLRSSRGSLLPPAHHALTSVLSMTQRRYDSATFSTDSSTTSGTLYGCNSVILSNRRSTKRAATFIR